MCLADGEPGPARPMRMATTNAARLALAALCLGATAAWAQADGDPGASGQSAGAGFGDVSFDFRLRSEFVDLDGVAEDASALTLRSRVTFESATFNRFQVLLEADNISALGSEEFNSTTNGVTDYPVVADPEGTDLNQAWLSFTGDSLTVRAGRQTIRHGTERFVGGVAWRQNEQSFDGIRVLWAPNGNFDLDLSYVNRVNRIFGPDDGLNPGAWKGDNLFVRANWALAGNHRLSAVGHLLDFDPQEGYAPGRTVNNSVDIFGAEYVGAFEAFTVNLTWATQQDAGASQLDYRAQMYIAEVIVPVGVTTLTAGYEVVGADDGAGFRTPVATLHKFHGWTDKFLATPGDGFRDAYLIAASRLGPVNLVVHWHDFRADASSADFGSELGASVTWPVNDQLTLLAKYATFSTDDSSRFADADKAWISLQMAF